MNLGFAPFRRRLLAFLAISLAVAVWPSVEHAKLDGIGFGQTQPWQYDQSANAIIEIAAEVDSGDEFARDGRRNGVAETGVYALVVGLSHHPIVDGRLPPTKQLTLFPSKTGPPSV